MAVRITVSELTCACLDARWRSQWLRCESPPAQIQTPSQSGLPVHGRLFHRLAESFVAWLCDAREREARSALRDGEALWHAFFDRFAGSELGRLGAAGKTESAHRLGLCLRAFAERLAKLRDRTRGFESWQDLFCGQEYGLKDVPVETPAGTLSVSGRVDAVRTHPEHLIEVVDYKLSRGAKAEHDLVQLAIYSHMLEIARPGLQFHGVLEYYEPELFEMPVSRADLAEIFRSVVGPIIHEIFARTPQPARELSSPDPSGPALAASPGDDDHARAIRDCFAAFKLAVEVVGRLEAPQLVRYRVQPATGVKVVSLATRAEDLQVRMDLPQVPRISAAQGCVVIDVPKVKPETVWWREIMTDPEYRADPSPCAIPIGIGVDGRLLRADFSDPNCCHALVAGTSGSGKSEFLKSMVAALMARNRPEALNLTLIDPKVLTFGWLRGCQYLNGPVLTTLKEIIPCLEQAVREMERRYRLLADAGLENLRQRWERGIKDIPYRLIVVDEFADLVLSGRETKQRFEALVARLAGMGRAAGIHLVLTTQRPDRNIVTGLIKANLPLKVCLRVGSHVNSQLVLGDPGAETLARQGRPPMRSRARARTGAVTLHHPG